MGWEAIPSAPEQDESREWIMNLIRQAVQYPQRNIEGMSQAEQTGQSILNQWLQTGTPAGVTTGMNQLTSTVQGQYDPMTSPHWQGYREESGRQEEQAISSLQRRSQLGGMGASTPALGQEGEVRRGFSSDRMQYLGGLMDRERGRQLTASGQLITAADQESRRPLTQAQGAMALGGLPRELGQMDEDALYESLVQTLLFPYVYQSPNAQTILNEPRYVYQPEDEDGGINWGQLAAQIGTRMVLGPAGGAAAGAAMG